MDIENIIISDTLLKQILTEDGVDYDPWGVCMSLHFNIAAELWQREAYIPKEWQYRPGNREPEPDYPLDYDNDTLVDWGNMLQRVCDTLKAKGLDY
jgi:hypothetical protein